MPWVIMKAVASDSARPIQPMFHSQSFLRQMSALDVPPAAVALGTRTMQTTKMMPAGAMSEMTTSSHVGIVSWCWNGYEMLRSTGEKGRLYGKTYSQPAPTAAMALDVVSRWCAALLWCRTTEQGLLVAHATLTLCRSNRECTSLPASSRARLSLVRCACLQSEW